MSLKPNPPPSLKIGDEGDFGDGNRPTRSKDMGLKPKYH